MLGKLKAYFYRDVSSLHRSSSPNLALLKKPGSKDGSSADKTDGCLLCPP